MTASMSSRRWVPLDDPPRLGLGGGDRLARLLLRSHAVAFASFSAASLVSLA